MIDELEIVEVSKAFVEELDGLREGRDQSPRVGKLTRAVLGFLAAVLLVAACTQPDERLNLLLVTFDTTRADRLGAYGYEAARTPNIDALAAKGVRFSRAYTTNPITLPAHASLMTGTYPVYHKVRDNSTYFVREELTTLAEVLGESGYDTAAFVGSFVLESRFNLDQGFDHYDDQFERDWSRDEIAAGRRAIGERQASLVSLAAKRWLRERKEKGKPFFAWLHYFDPHGPRNPPEPHRSLSPDPYDAEIAFADEQLGNVIRELEQQGLSERTLIVFTADHGEGLLDHSEPTHALLIFDTTVRVPLIFRIPGGVGGLEDNRLASLVDVMPSVLDLLDLETSSEQQGYSLFLPPGEQPQHRAVYMESMVGRLQHGWSALSGLRDESRKLIYGSVPKLFRIDEDPGELVDLSQREPELLAEMERELARWLEQHRSDDTADAATVPDQEAIRKLQSLGYLGASRSTVKSIADSLEAEGTDPHQVRHLFDLFGEALENVRNGELLRGIRQLEEIVREDPDNLAVLNYLAATYNQNGQFEKARELLERSLELQPSSTATLCELGRTLGSLGDEVGAIEHYELALDLDPTFLQPLLALGVLHAQHGRRNEAGPFLRRALEVEPANPEVLFNLGIWHLQGGDRNAAIRTLSQLASLNPQDRDAHFILGRLLAESGSDPRARPILERALVLNAASPDRVTQIQVNLERLR